MKKINVFIFLLSVVCLQMQAQRFLTPTFNEVEVTTDITYGVNATAITLAQAGEALPQELKLDLYEPKNDGATDRPLVIILHTGNFLPPQVNGGCTGTKADATAVNLANRLAKLGYVAASANYRLGWNPVDPNQNNRTFGIINAAYRGVQDSRTAIRFFKKSVAEEGNPYGINPDQIVVWGIGTGGYISLAAATLDTITDTFIPKFFANGFPMINAGINGNVEGTNFGVVPPGIPYPFPAGDTLNYPNHVGYSSDFNLAVNMGGALGDTSWVDPSDVPVISYHVPTDPFAPCEVGIVNVPPPINLPVVEVFGSCGAQPKLTQAGANACIEAGGPYNDNISAIARAENGGIESLFLFDSDDPTEGGQWSYSASADPYGTGGPATPCNTDVASADLYLDTIIMYFAPRAFACLNLTAAAREVISAGEVGLQMVPNPATDMVRIQTDMEYPIEDLQVFDLNGRLVHRQSKLFTNQVDLQRNSLPGGVYVVKLRVKDRIVAQKLVFK